MSLLLEKQYIGYVSVGLEKFRWLREYVAVARCPICGDSEASKSKRRFYFYRHKNNADSFNCQCKNCGYSTTFRNFLKDHDYTLYKQYLMEKFNNGDQSKETILVENKITEEQNSIFILNGCIPCDQLNEENYCKIYLRERMLTDEQLKLFWFTTNFYESLKGYVPDNELHRYKQEHRLIIPFFDRYGRLSMLQARTFSGEGIRYLTIKPNEQSEKIYGLERVDKLKTVYVCEGPIDSLMIDNCVATADIDLMKCTFGDVYIYDNQYRNKDVCKHINNAIKAGKTVVLFPESFKFKDLNEAIQSGMSKEELKELIDSRKFSGLKASLEFGYLRKI